MFLRKQFFNSLISKHNISKFLFCLFLFFNIFYCSLLWFEVSLFSYLELLSWVVYSTCFVVFVVGSWSDFVVLRQMLTLYFPCELVFLLHPSNYWISLNHENNLIFLILSALWIFPSIYFIMFIRSLLPYPFRPTSPSQSTEFCVLKTHSHTHTHTQIQKFLTFWSSITFQ